MNQIKLPRKIFGFSLIELMVAITTGLLVMIGVVQVFALNRGNFRVQNAYSVLQQSAEYLSEYLSRYIRMSGYRSTPANNSESGYVAFETLYTLANPFITGTDGTGFNGSDTITIQYQGSGNGSGTPDGTVVDCFNTGIDTNQSTTITFSINANQQLQCQAVDSVTNTNVTATVLNNVENMAILYGEDTDADGVPNRFVPINYAGINILNVVAVRITVLLISNNDAPVENTTTYNMLGTVYGPVNDYNLRLQFTTTIQLRNRLPGSAT